MGKENPGHMHPSNIKRWIRTNPNRALLIAIITIGGILRLVRALQATGVYHPDEIYQSLEMAHFLVYDVGIIPPEFRTENTTEYYYASRSWIFPWIFAIIMHIGEFFSMDYHKAILPAIRIMLALNSTLLIPISNKLVTRITGDKMSGLFAATFVAFWWRLVELTVRPLNNSFFLPMLFYGLYRMIGILQQEKIERSDRVVIMVFLGLVSYIRLDLGIIIFAFFISTLNIKKIRFSIYSWNSPIGVLKYPKINKLGGLYLSILVYGILGWVIGTLIDFHYYGIFLSVPVHWFMFAMRNGDLFGVEGRYYYFEELIYGDGLSFFFTITIVTLLLVNIKKLLPISSWLSQQSQRKGINVLFMTTLITWLLQSNIWDDATHKEIRFITGGLVLLLLTFAHASVLFARIFPFILESIISRVHKVSPITLFRLGTLVRIFLFVLLTVLLISASISYFADRRYSEHYDDINEGLAYVGSQKDVSGVIVIESWYLTGGYTYLHQNVSILYFNLRKAGDIPNYVRYDIENKDEGYNYLILPRYQMLSTPSFVDLLRDSGWTVDQVIDGKCDVWTRI